MARPARKSTKTEKSIGKVAQAPLGLLNLNSLLGFHMRMAQTIMHRDFINTLKELDLTQKQVAVLALLDENPGSSQIAISNVLESDPATMMAMMDRLEDRDLISRTRSRTDRRKQELNLTETGKTALNSAYILIADHEKRFRSLFTKTETDQLIGLLQRIQTFER